MYGDLINDCMEHALGDVTLHMSMTYIMTHIARELHCEYGFIGETRYSTEGNPYYRIHAMLGFPGNSSCMSHFVREQYLDFMQPNTLHDETFRSETDEPVICNDLDEYRKGEPLPEGHPPMKNFALFPLKRDGKHIGAVGLSSDTVDFTPEWSTKAKPLMDMTCSALLIHLEKRTIELHKVAFLANISHELRTPLNGIVCMTNMMKDTETSDEQTEMLDVISHCNVQMLDIVNDILDFTKIFTGGIALRKRTFSLKKCIQTIIDALKPTSHSGVTLDFVYDTDVDMIIGDETRVTQIFLNLLNNSIKFTKEGKIVLTIHAEDPPTGHEQDHSIWLTCSVMDTGIGIMEDKLKRLFERFQMSNADYLNSDYGVGLGLPITYHLVSLHGGILRAESTAGVGTTMTFTLGFDQLDNHKSMTELKEFYEGKNVLIISDIHHEREQLFHLFSVYGVKSMMCGIIDAPMYLSSEIFTFSLVVISVNDVSMPIMKLQATCPLYVYYQTEAPISSADHMWKKPIKEHHIAKMLSLAMDQNQDNRDVEEDQHIDIRILIAEDHKENQLVMTKLLRSLNYHNITIADNGLELYMKLMNEDYDIALVDLKMPVMDGLTAVKQFKSKSHKSIILVAVTASMSEHIRDECYRAGMNGYITKPIDRDELKTALNTVVRKKMSEL